MILEVKNTGEKDAVLNLGIMLANGARQYPSAITLTLRDAEGREHQFVLFEPAVIAGRLDPFILPLPKGADMRLPIDLSKYLLMTDRHIEDPPRPDTTKQYLVRAEFAGEGVTQAQANLDVKGLALMPFWLGKAVSNTVKTGPD